MQRVAVVGNSGSGKTTLGRELAGRLGAPFLEVDGVFHQPDWTPLPTPELRERVGAVTSGSTWVVDGNYSAVTDLVWARADTLVWLDLPRHVVAPRIVRRTLGRMITRRELWNGNREDWRNLLRRDPEVNIVLWSWTNHDVYRRRFTEQVRDPRHAHLDVVRLRTPREVARFLAGDLSS